MIFWQPCHRENARPSNANAGTPIGLTFKAVTGADLTPKIWSAIYKFYLSTVDRKWGDAYLIREFFTLLGHASATRSS